MKCPCGLKFSIHACPCGSHYTVGQCKCSRSKEDAHVKDGYEPPKENTEKTAGDINPHRDLQATAGYSGQAPLHDNLSGDAGDS